jgi:hypothetical protein
MYNYNLIWAWPTHAIVAFLISSKKQNDKLNYYFIAYLLALVMSILLGKYFGFFKDEIFPNPIFILFMITALRVSLYLRSKS